MTAISRFVLRFLKISIHIAHAAWIVALIASISQDRAITTYALFMPPLILASCLEMCRWALLGRKSVEISGVYSHASAIEQINREFLTFSWYIISTSPPYQLLERYAMGAVTSPQQKTQSQIFARFWLKSEVVLPLMACLLMIYGLYPGTHPLLYGFGKHFSIVCLVWIVEFGFFSKQISVFLFSTFVRIQKGF